MIWPPHLRPPREWQREALPVIRQALIDGERPVVRAVTGAGKAQLISELSAAMSGNRTVIVTAPRERLVEQLSGIESGEAGSLVWRLGALGVGVYYGRRKVNLDARVIVACNPSLPALASELQLRGVTNPALIVDECHRSETDQIKAAVEVIKPRYLVGFSATPWSQGGKGHLSMFSREVYSYGLTRAIREGVLVNWHREWSNASGNVDDIVADMIKDAEGPGIVSALNVDDAEAYAARLTGEGYPAASIHSYLPRADQRQRIADLLAGRYRCLVHVALLTEGVDIPALRWLAMRRPTASATRFLQELGRVLRAHPGKTRAVLYDPYDIEKTVGLTHQSKVGDLERLVEREQAGKGEPTEQAERQPAVYPPVIAVPMLAQWARRQRLALVEAGLAEMEIKSTSWRSGFPSPRQVETLKKLGGAEVRAVIGHVDRMTSGEVSDMIGYLVALRKAQRAGRQLPKLEPAPIDALTSLR